MGSTHAALPDQKVIICQHLKTVKKQGLLLYQISESDSPKTNNPKRTYQKNFSSFKERIAIFPENSIMWRQPNLREVGENIIWIRIN